MLQQTQVRVVIPYFERFMARFPTVAKLAAADEDEVLHLWTGLGYYSRARNLLAAARAVDAAGRFPESVDELMELPGVGRSTAGAISSIAFGHPAPILDGNVKRVLARYTGLEGWPGTSANQHALWESAAANTPPTRCADYTQAMMDLGATLCTRTRPACAMCPLHDDCAARRTGSTERIPAPKPKRERPTRETHMLMLETPDRAVLLQKRPRRGIWGGLWSFPECGLETIEATLDLLAGNHHRVDPVELEPVRHGFTHYRLLIRPLHVRLLTNPGTVSESATMGWFPLDAPIEVGLARPVTRLLDRLRTAT